MQEARCRTQSWDSGIMPWTKGRHSTTEPPQASLTFLFPTPFNIYVADIKYLLKEKKEKKEGLFLILSIFISKFFHLKTTQVVNYHKLDMCVAMNIYIYMNIFHILSGKGFTRSIIFSFIFHKYAFIIEANSGIHNRFLMLTFYL